MGLIAREIIEGFSFRGLHWIWSWFSTSLDLDSTDVIKDLNDDAAVLTKQTAGDFKSKFFSLTW